MRRLIIALMLVSANVYAQEETDPKEYEAPLLSPYRTALIQVSDDNRREFLDSTKIHAADAAYVMSVHRQQQWLRAFLSVLAPIIVLLFILRKNVEQAVRDWYARTFPPPNPKTVALNELKNLQVEFSDQESVKANTSKMTDILRTYIETNLKLEAHQKTTEEFLQELIQHPSLNNETQQLLLSVLQETDLIKFANYTPSQEELQQTVEKAEQFIQAT